MKIIPSKKSIPDQIFEALLEAISNDEFPVGSRLPSEHELCEAFGVSRPSVKTAMDRLQLLGLVEQKVGDGTYVKDASISDLLQLYSRFFFKPNETNELLTLRRALEIEAFALAIQHKNSSYVENLRSLTSVLTDQSANQPMSSTINTIIDFHFTLCLISGNHYLIQLHQMIQPALRRNIEEHFNEYQAHLNCYLYIMESINTGSKMPGESALSTLLNIQ